MKLSRILAIALAGIMLVLCLAACGTEEPKTDGEGDPSTQIALYVTLNKDGDINDNDSLLFLNKDVKIEGDTQTAIEALKAACDANDYYEYELTNDGESVNSIIDVDEDITYAVKDDEETGISYFWNVMVNGEEAASDTVVKAGDVIVYCYSEILPEESEG